jgi:hypothetical protein
MKWEMDYIIKSRGEAVIPWHIDNLEPGHLTEMLRCKGTIRKTVCVDKFEKCELERHDGTTGRAGS